MHDGIDVRIFVEEADKSLTSRFHGLYFPDAQKFLNNSYIKLGEQYKELEKLVVQYCETTVDFESELQLIYNNIIQGRSTCC